MVPKMFVINEEKNFQQNVSGHKTVSLASKELLLFWVSGGGETGAA